MKTPFHPLCVLVVFAAPFVAYSIWRTGYDLSHLCDVRLFGTRYVWELMILASVTVACCRSRWVRERKVGGFVTGIAIGVFLAAQAHEEYPSDYKLWVYIVAPIFTWSIALSLAAVLALRGLKNA